MLASVRPMRCASAPEIMHTEIGRRGQEASVFMQAQGIQSDQREA
jgi:hypothetical protein